MAVGPTIIKTEKRSGEESDRLWMARIRGGLRRRRNHFNGDNLWRREKQLLEGRHWETLQSNTESEQPSPDNPRSRIVVNKTGSAVDNLLPFLVNREPEFIGRPKRGADETEIAKAQAALLNNRWQELRFTRQLKKAAENFVTFGTGFLSTGYIFDLDESATPDKDGMISYDDFVRQDEPTLRSISPFNVIPDWSAPDSDLHSSRYFIEVKHKILQDVISNRFYSQAVTRDIASGKEAPTTLNDFITEFGTPNKSIELLRDLEKPLEEDSMGGQKIVIEYHVWDKKFRMFKIFLDGVERPLLEDAWPYDYIDGFPFAMAKFISIPDEFFGLGLPYALRDQQDELNRIRTFEFLHRRRHAARKVGYQKNALSDIDVNLLDDPEGGTYVPLNTNARLAFTEVPAPDIPQDTYRIEGIIEQDFNDIMGRDQLFAGGQLPSRTSAAEIRARQGFIGAKIEGKTGELDNMVLDAGIQVLQHMKANFTIPQVVRLIGPDGLNWVELSPSDIREEVTIELESTSKERFDPEREAERALTFWQTAVQGLQLGLGQVVNVQELFKWVAEKMRIKDIDRFLLGEDPTIPAQGGAAPAPGLPTEGETSETAQLQQEGVAPESLAGGAGF